MVFLLGHLISLVSFALAVAVLARASEQRRPTGSLVAWLFAILLLPYVGIPLYFLLGGRKLEARAASKTRLPQGPVVDCRAAGRLATMLCASGAAAPTRGNQLVLLASGEAAFAAILALIESAQTSIHVSTLIFADDETGAAVAAALARKSQSGVRVRVLIDALFKFRSSRVLLAGLRSAGVHIAWFMPVWSLWPRQHANLRLHRKVVLVDGSRGILGGMNLAREYMGPVPMPGRWRDLSIRVLGPAVRDIERVFASDWRFAAKEDLPEPAEPAAEVPAEGVPSVQVVGSGPDTQSDPIYDALLSATFDAQSRLWVATPYFVPDEALLRALVLAVRRGVDVRVVLPRRSNHLTADLAGASYLRELAREGAQILRYTPGMLHAKLVLIDSDLAVLGSANMDMRSLFLDYEIALVLRSEAGAEELTTWFESVFAESGGLEPASRGRKLLESCARLIAPLE